MKKVFVSASMIKPNPYRKEVGKLNNTQINKIVESFKMSCFGENQRFEVRKKGAFYELVYGHHRLEAVRKVYGKDRQVEIIIQEYDNKMMLQEMLRENLSQNSSNILAKIQAVRLARITLKKNKTGHTYQKIKEFLSKEGKLLSLNEVRSCLIVSDKLNPKLLHNISNFSNVNMAGKKQLISENKIPFKRAFLVASVTSDYKEQHDLLQSIENSYLKNTDDIYIILKSYVKLSFEQKQSVRSGDVNFALIPNIATQQDIDDIKQVKPHIDKVRAALKENSLASKIYVSLTDLKNLLERANKMKINKKLMIVFEKLYEDVAKELIEKRKTFTLKNVEYKVK